MKNVIASFLLLLVWLYPLKFYAQNYELVWSDEFDYNGLPDSTKWSYDIGGNGWGNQELQYYTNARSENARVENGYLIIEARNETYQNSNYTSARLVTKNKGDWLYGKVEVRAKIPGGKGAWPAIWMLPTNWVYGGWPKSGEMDIMEYVGYDKGVIHATVHTEAYNHSLGTQKGNSITINDVETVFHNYSMEWTEDKIMFFVDDTKYFTFYKKNGYQYWPFDKTFHLLLNIAVGGSWGGAQGIDNSIFPIKMYVDYVRVYQDKTLFIQKIYNNTIECLYPNPANEFIFITAKEKFSYIQILSLSGQEIANFYMNADTKLKVEIGSLRTGTYLLVLKNYKKKIIGSAVFIKK